MGQAPVPDPLAPFHNDVAGNDEYTSGTAPCPGLSYRVIRCQTGSEVGSGVNVAPGVSSWT